jgi:hypothetical protein
MATLQEGTVRLTGVCLVASVVLIGPSLVGVGATPPLVGGLLLLSGGLFAVRDSRPVFPTVAGHDLRRYQQDLWVGPLVGAVGAVAVLGASPAELQSIGGIAGAVGMANYFLRPVYLTLIAMARRALS